MIKKEDLESHGYYIIFNEAKDSIYLEFGEKFIDDHIKTIDVKSKDGCIEYYENNNLTHINKDTENYSIESVKDDLLNFIIKKYGINFIFKEKDGVFYEL